MQQSCSRRLLCFAAAGRLDAHLVAKEWAAAPPQCLGPLACDSPRPALSRSSALASRGGCHWTATYGRHLTTPWFARLSCLRSAATGFACERTVSARMLLLNGPHRLVTRDGGGSGQMSRMGRGGSGRQWGGARAVMVFGGVYPHPGASGGGVARAASCRVRPRSPRVACLPRCSGCSSMRPRYLTSGRG